MEFGSCIHLRLDEVLLASDRRELDLKQPRWQTPAAKTISHNAMEDELCKLIDTRSALRPLSVQQSRQFSQLNAQRVLEPRLVWTSSVDESGNEAGKCRATVHDYKDPSLLRLTQDKLIHGRFRRSTRSGSSAHRITLSYDEHW